MQAKTMIILFGLIWLAMNTYLLVSDKSKSIEPIAISSYDHNQHRVVFTECMDKSPVTKEYKQTIERCHNIAGKIVKDAIAGKNRYENPR